MHPFSLKTATALAASALGLSLASSSVQACASCGCTLSSDWGNLSSANGMGLKLDVRYDYLNQNQLRSGTKAISPEAAAQVVNNGNPQEVEVYTKNDYLTASFDYSPNSDWGVNVVLPYIVRNHATLGIASDGITAGPDGGQYTSRTASVGDVKVVGRYQGFANFSHLGLTAGLKLPTGSYTKMGQSTDAGAPGPVLIDRGLQPGTGTTELILGVHYMGSVNTNWDYFAQALVQTSLNSRDNYKPGTGTNVNLGLQYKAFDKVVPQVQLNIRQVAADSGANADTVSTGGTLAYLSPGISAPLTQQSSVYAFMQVPIYQKVNGVQLTPRYTASVGLRYAF